MTSPKGVCALTGAHGYVGSVLRRALEANGWSVLSLVRHPAPGSNEIPWSLEMPGSDSSDPAAAPVAETFRERGVSALVHAAWDMSLVRRRDMERINVLGSIRLLAGARAANLRRIIFISSISAYEGVSSLYGQTKLAVERAALVAGGVVIRPGMVFGEPPGAMFAALQRQAAHSMILLPGNGSYPQYFVHQDDLAAAALQALAMDDPPVVPVTVAHPRAWPFRSLLAELGVAQGSRPRFLPVPWRLLYTALRTGEAAGLKMPFRSDSLYSLVHQNPHPEMNAAMLGVEPRAFSRNAQNAKEGAQP